MKQVTAALTIGLAPAGIHAACVQADKTGRWRLAACHSEGVVTVRRIADGVVTGAPVQTVETGRKAHCIQTDPANRFAFVPHVAELNKVGQSRFDAVNMASEALKEDI